MENTLSRDGTTPNQMEADLDMNSNDVMNASSISTETLSIAGQDVTAADAAVSTLPTQTTHTGKVLTTNGSAASWIETSNSAINMTALVAATEVGRLELLGFHAAGDGGGGNFYWDSTQDKANHTGIDVIDPDNTADLATWDSAAQTTWFTAGTGTGCWMRIPSGYDEVKSAGAKVDGSTDDTLPITNIELLSGVTELFIPEGTCIVTSYTLTKTYRGPGFISVDGIVQRQNADWEDVQPNGGRSIIRYFNGSSVYVSDKVFGMNEFRAQGQYSRAKAPTWTTTDNYTQIDTDVGRFGSATVRALNNWYAAFVCANAGDVSASTQAVPFLRVRSIAANVVTLGYAGFGDDELGGLLAAATYTWTPSELVGLKVLVCSEAVLTGKTNVQGSRVTTITAATTTTITLADGSTVGARDWLLPAPSGFEFFKYLGSFIMDTAEVTNIYDSGTLVRYLGVSNANFTNNYTGSQATPVAIKLGGYISPLATAAILETKYSLSTASLGYIVEYFGGDISHFYETRFDTKEGTPTKNVRFNNVQVTFLWKQEYAYKNAGTLIGAKSNDEHYVYGWIEN